MRCWVTTTGSSPDAMPGSQRAEPPVAELEVEATAGDMRATASAACASDFHTLPMHPGGLRIDDCLLLSSVFQSIGCNFSSISSKCQIEDKPIESTGALHAARILIN